MKTGLLAAGIAAIGASRVNALSDYVKNNVRENLGGDRIVHIGHEHLSPEAVSLLESHGADHFGSEESSSHFRLSPEAHEALKDMNVDLEDATERWISHFESNFQDENFFCTADDCASRDMQAFYSSYQTLANIQGRATDLANSVSFASVISLGQSYEGRNQLAVSISDDGNKPIVFYFCNIHAREWLTPMYCTYMVEQLIADGGHPLLETFTFVVLVSANPDGYQYSTTQNNLWRKTRRPNPGSSCVGTDPNRNYDNRHCGAGTSNNPCSETFCGPNPWSEVEVANIRDFGLANADRIIAMNDVHAYGRLWMTPYGGTTQNPSGADFQDQQACNAAAVAGIQSVSGGSLWDYGPVHSTIYSAAGVSVDYFYDQIGVVYSMTAEVRGTSFQPSAANILPSNQEVFAGVVASLECVREREGLGGGGVDPNPVTQPTPAPGVPASWTCDDSWYNIGPTDYCDCECGAPDPDCDIPGIRQYGCNNGQVCESGVCVPGA